MPHERRPRNPLEAARRDMQSAHAAVASLPEGFVRQRLEICLKDLNTDAQNQLWRYLDMVKRQSASVCPEREKLEQRSSSGRALGGAGPREKERIDEGSGGMVSSTASVLKKADRAKVEARSPLHAAALALHCLLLSEGFVCTGQDAKAGSVKGFAPPIRDIPEEHLVPVEWDAEVGLVSFRYRLPKNPRDVYLFKAASTGDGGPTSFYLAQRDGETFSAGVDLAPLSDRSSRFFDNEEFFENLFVTFRREVISHFLPKQARGPGPLTSPGTDSGKVIPGSNPRPSCPVGIHQPSRDGGGGEDDPLRIGPPRFAGPPGVGPTPFIPATGGDFGGDIFPSIGGMGGGSGGLPGSGGLLGPGHPMFSGGRGAGYMEPRFDPVTPPMSGQPWAPGIPEGPRRGGRGQGGPGRGNPCLNGGPDNDHLPPPRGSDSIFF